MNLDVLLVSTRCTEISQRSVAMPPLGLGYLAAVLAREGYSVAVLDMNAEKLKGRDLVRVIDDCQPRVVGFNTMSSSFKNSLRAAQLVKEMSPTTAVIVGGAHATFLVEETLACSAVDVLVRYEGEETLLELMRYFDGDGQSLDDIQGIAFRQEGAVHQTPPRPLIADLDSLPFPKRDLFKLNFYGTPGALISARGCPASCIFCVANALYPHPRYRTRAPHAVVDEIEELIHRHGQKTIFFADDTLTIDKARVSAICDQMIARGLRVQWGCEARINTMTPKLARQMAEAGCTEVQYGIETGNMDTMQHIRKGIAFDQIEHVIDFSLEAGLDVFCSFIIGLPWDTKDSVQQSLDYADRLCRMSGPSAQPWHQTRGKVTTIFSPLTPLPGTYLYDNAEALGIRFLTRDWDRYTFGEPVIATQNLTDADMRHYYRLGLRGIRDLYLESVGLTIPNHNSGR